MNLKQILIEPFIVLENKTFAKLYLAQTISLLGDAFSWVGLALLAYQIDAANSPIILATALTLRVTAFIIFSPFAGVLADKVQRKKILYLTHFIRMAIVCCLPFITSAWQIYVLVFLLNVFNAFFTPTYRAIIPQIIEIKYYREAVGLSTATFQLLGILGPALAGIVAVWFGVRQIFFLDAISFIIAGILILSISANDLQKGVTDLAKQSSSTWNDVIKGIRLLFGNKILQFALGIEFVSAIAGAMILVNTISHIKNDLLLDDKYYGWAMATFGIGAAISAFILGSLDKSKTRSTSLISGALLLGISICLVNYFGYATLLVLWLFAGLGQSLAEMPSETLIAETISSQDQGKVYGSHFAFSHLWWAIAYPIAGFLGSQFPKTDFLYGGIITSSLAILCVIIFKPTINFQNK
ncbi:MFS transporter [Flavobacterium urumqiense]|uniref:MFS transporter, NRE family, putaive nickel resistance protein n=1 Tax=Flavobacterium urumqiense TaxID=935224 RepID=A0A1H5YSA0_9FLAO|nr:MFS transporter [Flavobacterium urumqiense]SEG26532.1 MFS transporter, NRE family, putaive nickel resistance protein [Flavobacterium urumqiense]